MSLPKLDTPTFELKLPSTGDMIQYRPFLVKEEKILLIARESGEKSDIHRALRQIINNCVITENFDIDNMTTFDLDYIFIKLRASSIDNIVEFTVEDSDDGIEYDLKLDLNTVEVKFPDNHSKKIMVNDEIGIMMKYPTPKLADKMESDKTITDITFTTINECIDYIFDAEETYPWKDVSSTERVEFLDKLSIPVYDKIEKFFETSPMILEEVKYENSAGVEKTVVFKELEDFFVLG